jgi:hypothetical protein
MGLIRIIVSFWDHSIKINERNKCFEKDWIGVIAFAWQIAEVL